MKWNAVKAKRMLETLARECEQDGAKDISARLRALSDIPLRSPETLRYAVSTIAGWSRAESLIARAQAA